MFNIKFGSYYDKQKNFLNFFFEIFFSKNFLKFKIKYVLKAKKCTIEYLMQKIFWIEILPRKLNFYARFNQKPMYFQAPFSYTKNKYFWTKCISLGREMLKVQ